MPSDQATNVTPVDFSNSGGTQAPAPVDPANKVVPMADAQGPKPSTGKKILVVEDEPDARTFFVDILSMEGYDVSSAVDGIDALAKAGAEKYDLILLDIVMPNKDGLDTLEELKADKTKYGDPIVVMLTNISGDAAVEKAMELGAKGFKLKIKMEPDQLISDVAAYLSGKVPEDEQEAAPKAA